MTLLFTHKTYPFGGSEKVSALIGAALSAMGHRIYICATEFRDEHISDDERQCIIFKTLPSRDYLSNENRDFIRDLVVSDDIWAVILPETFFEDIRSITENSSAKLIYALHSQPMWEATNKEALAKRRKSQSLLSLIDYYTVQYPKYNWLKTHRKKTIRQYKHIYSQVDCFTVLCDEYRDDMIKLMGLDDSEHKLVALPNPTKEGVFTAQSKQKTILYCGRLSYADKRIDKLLRIWGKVCCRYPEWELQIVGDGPERANLEALSHELDLHRVTFFGHRTDVCEFYKKASVVCMTSHYEGWNLSLSEAQAYGAVPLAYNCSAGVRSIISHSGKDGFLIEENNEQQYIECLELLMSDHALLCEMQQNCYDKSTDYRPTFIATRWIDMIVKLFPLRPLLR